LPLDLLAERFRVRSVVFDLTGEHLF